MLLDRKMIFIFLLLGFSSGSQAKPFCLTQNEYGVELLKLSASKDYSLENFRRKIELLHLIAEESEKKNLLLDGLNYYMGEGVAEELYETIYDLGENVIPDLKQELKNDVKCDEKYKDICLSSSSKKSSIATLLDLFTKKK